MSYHTRTYMNIVHAVCMYVCVCGKCASHKPHTACLVLSVTGAGFERNHWIIYDSQWSTNWDAKWLWRRPLKQHRMPSVPACIYIKLIPCDIGFQYLFPLFSCSAESAQAIYSALRLQVSNGTLNTLFEEEWKLGAFSLPCHSLIYRNNSRNSGSGAELKYSNRRSSQSIDNTTKTKPSGSVKGAKITKKKRKLLQQMSKSHLTAN